MRLQYLKEMWRSRLWPSAQNLPTHIFTILVLLLCPLPARADATRDYPVVYVRAPRSGDNTEVRLPEVFDPIHISPGTDLMLLRPDGSEEVLIAAGAGAVVDPFPSFDGEWIYYSYFHDQRPEALNVDQHNASRAGADIYKIHVRSRQIIRLTFQEWTPAGGAANWSPNNLSCGANSPYPNTYCLGYGIFNLGPTPLPGGRIMFTSSRDGYLAPKNYTFPNLQLYVMDDDGKNVEKIGYLNVGSALHPTILMDGRVMFSSYESQGLRDPRIWGLWAIWPDGRKWEPLISAFIPAGAIHFQTQFSSGDLAAAVYYNKNNNGFGTLVTIPPTPPDPSKPPFGKADPFDITNPSLPAGNHTLGYPWFRLSFSPQGLDHFTRFSHFDDAASATDGSGNWLGKVTNPAGAPNNDVLLVWTPGPANSLQRPTDRPAIDAGIYLVSGDQPTTHPQQLQLLKNSPAYNELQPRALVPYRQIYGVNEPVNLPWLPNDGTKSSRLPSGTPFGLVGTSSMYKRDTAPADNSSYGPQALFQQGGDIGTYSNADIHAIRIIAMEGAVHRGRGPGIGNTRAMGFQSYANEIMRILGEIPVRKNTAGGSPVMDVDGNPDTSFLAKIPADVPFTFQTIDADGFALNMAQTWHQVRPGEVRTDCGGCHAHAHIGTDFAATAAARGDYAVTDLTRETTLITKTSAGASDTVKRSGALDVEFYRDIKPILDAKCVSCHSAANTAQNAGLILDGSNAAAVLTGASQSESYAGTKYIKPFQSRKSLLAWKIFGRRTDGDSSPISGAIMPPVGSGVAPLTHNERMTIVRWMDLGAPINFPDQPQLPYTTNKWGWFADGLRPTLTMSSPRAGWDSAALGSIRIGMFDYYSGLDQSSFSVKANFSVQGRGAGAELAGEFVQSADHVWSLVLNPPLTDITDGEITVSVKDQRGNVSRITRTFSVGSEPPRPEPTPTPTTPPTVPTAPGSPEIPNTPGEAPDESEPVECEPLLSRVVFDFDGDCISDRVWSAATKVRIKRRKTKGMMYYVELSSTGQVVEHFFKGATKGKKRLTDAHGDYDLDGIYDLAVTERLSSTKYRLSVNYSSTGQRAVTTIKTKKPKKKR